MDRTMELLAARLASLGLPMEGDALARAQTLLDDHNASPDSLSDLQLMTICVGAYRPPGSGLPPWV